VLSVGRLRYLEARPGSDARARGVLVLLHAFPLNARMWERQLALSGRGWRVIAPHFRGFDGGSDDPPAQSVDDYAGDVVDLLDALHIHDAIVGGLSLGGYVAFALLRNASRYVRGLILADTKATADTPEGVEGRKRMIELVGAKGPATVAEELLPKLLGETTRRSRPAVVEQVHSLATSSSAEAIAGALRVLMTRPDSTPQLGSIHVPTLIVVGDEDTVTPPSAAAEMHRAIAGSELITIPEAGHLANLEQPDQFDAVMAQFLDHRV
jgi:3-oxoadipate enol-lactonase